MPSATISLPLARTTPPDLENPSLFTKVESVPLLDEHIRVKKKGEDKEGNPIYEEEYVSERQLKTICQNTRDRERSGDPGLIFIGHTNKDKPETEQPPLIGYLKNYRMGLYNGRPHILADYYINNEFYNNDYNVLSQFPRRSVEVYGKNDPNGYIDSVSVQKRAPARDLGLVTYSKLDDLDHYVCDCGGCNVEKRDNELTEENDKDDNDKFIDDSNENGDDMDGAKEVSLSPDTLKALIHGIVLGMAELMGGGEEEEAPPEEVPDMGGGPIEPEVEPGGEMGGEEPKPEEGEAMGAGAGMPSGSNTFTPGSGMRDNYTRSELDRIISTRVRGEVDRYARETGELRNANAALQVTVSNLVEENRFIKRKSTLEDLRDNKGIVFKDFFKTLEKFSRLTDEDFDDRVQEMVDNYEKSPIDKIDIPVIAGRMGRDINGKPTNGYLDPDNITEEEARSNAVYHYAKENGLEMTQTNGPAIVKAYLKATRGK